MTRFGLLVLALLVIQAVPARADVPSPYPRPYPPGPPVPLPPPVPAPAPNPPAPPVDLGPIAPPVPEGFKPSPVLTLPSPPTPPAPQPPAPARTQVDPVTGLPARVPRNPPPPPAAAHRAVPLVRQRRGHGPRRHRCGVGDAVARQPVRGSDRAPDKERDRLTRGSVVVK
ncbi:hypothetical protein [Frigoriglobus tundricola]|uniref:Uncharacterized protein n=1 Tax=Frigoriglobus tundricola TaxID=2774151 RepID=A0A6M5YVD2_9BACT|nr:hypothetical protein [Frigoriglobus tundricola]QJW97908.1 hypothetical protein FTUN_5488 [Frigoriglobus tundricola]